MAPYNSFPFIFASALWMLSSVNGVAAKVVCHTDAQGNEQCKQMLSPGVIAAIVGSGVGFIALCLGVWLYIRRTEARRKAAAIEAAFTVEPSQLRGPPVMIRAHTTYDNPVSASYASVRNDTSTQGYATDTGYYPTAIASAYLQGSDISSASNRAALYGGAGSAPVLPPLQFGGPASAAPITATHNGKVMYPFTGISSSQLPTMPQPAATTGTYAGGGFGNASRV